MSHAAYGPRARCPARGGASLLAAIVLCALWLAPALARAEVRRFAVIIGNDMGHGGDIPLRYAEDDAAKVHAVLENLGGFRPEDMLLLRGQDAATVRRALVSMNERVRGHTGAGPADTVLFVYYSGHADAANLHLGRSSLALDELSKLVAGSAAAFRVLVLDACRSGAVTRRKGGRRAPPVPITLGTRLTSEGTVFWTASAANEDAQESDEIRGSFFTHSLVSGLVGAADGNQDGQVTLDEAYRYSYQHTLRATSRTLAGIQHPTFRYDLRGQGNLVLTSVGPGWRQAIVDVPVGRTYLLMRGGLDGPVTAEVSAEDRSRRIALSPGRYFVRARAHGYMLEGLVHLEGGRTQTIDDRQLERIAYARLARKGMTAGAVHGIQVGLDRRSALYYAGACTGFHVGYTREARYFDLVSRVRWCSTAEERLQPLPVTDPDIGPVPNNELAFDLRLSRTWDISRVAVGMGLSAGAALIADTTTDPEGLVGPYRAVGILGPVASLAADLYGRSYLAFELGVPIYIQKRRVVIVGDTPVSPAEPYTIERELDTELVLRLGGSVGMRW